MCVCVCVCVCVCLLGPVPHLLGALGCQNCHLQASRFFRSPGLIFGPLLARFPPPAPPVPRDSVEEGVWQASRDSRLGGRRLRRGKSQTSSFWSTRAHPGTGGEWGRERWGRGGELLSHHDSALCWAGGVGLGLQKCFVMEGRNQLEDFIVG